MNNDYESTQKLYKDEARARWGDTEAYQASERRMANYSQDEWNELFTGMDMIMDGFADLNKRGVAPDHEKPRLQVRKLQMFINEQIYPCSDEILAQLGEMYVADERFTKDIDKHGEGTAAYISACIKNYLQ